MTRVPTTHRRLPSALPAALAAAMMLVLAACGGAPLPAGAPPGEATATESTARPTTLPLFPNDPPDRADERDDADADENDDESSGESADTAAPVEAVDATAPVTGSEWVDVTANLLGLGSTCGNVSYISSHPSREQVIVGISAQGLFEFDTAGSTWIPLGTGAGSAGVNNRMTWIEYDPLEADRYWQSGAYGDGVFRTDDNGATFARIADLRHLDFVSVDPTDPFRSTMMVGVHEESIVYRSVDAGSTWEDISANLPSNVGFTPYPIVLDSDTHLLGTYKSENSGVFRSQDAGMTWTTVHQGAVSGPPVVNGDEVFWLRERGGGVIRSFDRGATFSTGPPTGGRPATLERLADGRLVTHNATTLLVSNDSGMTWTPFGPELPYEPRGVAVSEAGDAAFVWRFSCNFGEGGNPVTPMSIVRLDVDFAAE